MKLKLLYVSFRYAVAPSDFYVDEKGTKKNREVYEPFLEDYDWTDVEDVDRNSTLSRVFWDNMPDDSFNKDDCYDQITEVEFRYELTTSHYKDGIEIPLTYNFSDYGRLLVYDDPFEDEDMGYEYGNGYHWSDIADVPVKKLMNEHKEIIDEYHTEKL